MPTAASLQTVRQGLANQAAGQRTAAGKVVQRLIEMEKYRVLALMAQPLATQVSPRVDTLNSELQSITSEMHALGASDLAGQRALLERLTRLTTSALRIQSTAQYRFSAASAYAKIVGDRIDFLRSSCAVASHEDLPRCIGTARRHRRHFSPYNQLATSNAHGGAASPEYGSASPTGVHCTDSASSSRVCRRTFRGCHHVLCSGSDRIRCKGGPLGGILADSTGGCPRGLHSTHWSWRLFLPPSAQEYSLDRSAQGKMRAHLSAGALN